MLNLKEEKSQEKPIMNEDNPERKVKKDENSSQENVP
jgi:hypothetical protein